MNKVLFLIMLLFASNVFASQTNDAKIVQVDFAKNHGSFIFVKLDVAPASESCATNGYWNYTFPVLTEIDKAIVSAVLTVFISGTQVNIIGTGTCNEFGTVETGNSIRLVK